MNGSFDVVVAGLGAVGSAVLYDLARRGVNVLGIDQFAPPHTFGSSHGETRVIREAYFEHPSYVPLVQRAYELWTDLERVSGEQVYQRTGGVMIGRQDSAVVSGALRSAREHRLAHEFLNSAAIAARFPGLRPDPHMAGVFEPRAGILFPEKCIAAHLRLAEQAGAQVRVNEKLHDWHAEGEEIVIHTSRGICRTRKMIVSCGSWISSLVPDLRRLFQIERQVLLWFKAREPALFAPDVFPIHLWEYEKDKMFYGFPDLGSGVKLAFHHQGDLTNPVTVDRNIRPDDINSLRAVVERYLPEAIGPFIRGTVCLYTNTPDGHFIVDKLPGRPNVILASPCSGHGFKFASAIGEVLADLALDLEPALDLSLFSLRRFAFLAPESDSAESTKPPERSI